jgi:hypothetical protein
MTTYQAYIELLLATNDLGFQARGKEERSRPLAMEINNRNPIESGFHASGYI